MKSKGRRAVPAILAALGALSLGWAACKKYMQGQQDNASDLSEDKETKKRTSSEKHSPDKAKRHKTANGSKGAVTDISALMAAKTKIPTSDQSDPEKLGQHYAKMATKFEEEGLNVKAVHDAKKYYSIEGENPEPMVYMKFETPLARGAVRLGVFRIVEEEANDLPDLLFHGTQEIGQTFPDGSVVHYNRKEHYHLTVQMISHPSNPRPDTQTPGGGLNLKESMTMVPAPLPSILHKETSTYTELASSYGSPELKVHSIIFSNSGTLLLLFTDTTGQVYNLRTALAKAFPGAVENQPSILHVTLARLLTAEQIDQGQREKIVKACSKLTEKLRGKVFRPKALW